MTRNLRPIRSFVKRQGRMTKGQMSAYTKSWQDFGLNIDTESHTKKKDFSKIFGRVAPLILEIGFGMGEALLQLATQHPENNYLGIEVHKPGIGAVLLGIEKSNLQNIRLFDADALDVLTYSIADQSLTGLHLFFPDPWPKKRHHKRRIVTDNFAQLIRSKLKMDGYVHMATDWEDYALHMLTVMTNAPGFINVAGQDQFILRPATRPLTRFEQRGTRLGHKVWDLLFLKEE